MSSKSYVTLEYKIGRIDQHLSETLGQPLFIDKRDKAGFSIGVPQVVFIDVGKYHNVVILKLEDSSLQFATKDDIESLWLQVRSYG